MRKSFPDDVRDCSGVFSERVNKKGRIIAICHFRKQFGYFFFFIKKEVK